MNEEDIRILIREELSDLIKSDRYTFHKIIQMLDGRNIQTGKSNGTKIGTETTQKIGFYNTTPVDQPDALTAGLTTISHTEPGGADYSINTVSSGITDSWGFSTNDEAKTLLKVVKNLQVRLAEVEARLEETGLIASN